MPEIILIQISGQDRPGLTAQLTQALGQYDVDILDIGQAVIHETLSLGILVRIPSGSQTNSLLKDILFAAHEIGVNLKFTPVTGPSYESWVQGEGKKRHIVTLLGRKISAKAVYGIAATLADNDLNIDIVSRLSGRSSLTREHNSALACVEFSVRGEPRDEAAIRRSFMDISAEMGVDIAFQEDDAFRRNRRLVAFDMDSTLIQAEVIDELAKEAGVGDKVAAITESAMRGEIDFKQSLRKRLSLLNGLSASVLESVASRIPLTEGAERLIKNLKRFGYKIAIISGGFTYFGQKLKDRLDIDYLFANELEIKDGALTGQAVGEIVDASRKALLLRQIADKEKISLKQVIAVGDGANDLPMLSIAGLGIAFHAKPLVKQGARQSISTLGLDSILYLMGIRERDIEA